MADVCVPWGSGVPTPLQQLHLEQAGRAWGGWLLRELGEVAPQAKGHGQRPLSRVQFPDTRVMKGESSLLQAVL